MKKVRQLWMRLGDGGDYEVQGSPYDAGNFVSELFHEVIPGISWTDKGVVLDPGFTGYNYISLFWGDEDAQPVGRNGGELTRAEKDEFESGLHAGLHVKPPPKRLRIRPAGGRMTSFLPRLGGMR